MNVVVKIPCETERLCNARRTLRDPNSTEAQRMVALDDLSYSKDWKDQNLRELYLKSRRFQAIKSQAEIDEEELIARIEAWRAGAEQFVMGAVVVLGFAFIAGQLLKAVM